MATGSSPEWLGSSAAVMSSSPDCVVGGGIVGADSGAAPCSGSTGTSVAGTFDEVPGRGVGKYAPEGDSGGLRSVMT